jgi:hypothetical protein
MHCRRPFSPIQRLRDKHVKSEQQVTAADNVRRQQRVESLQQRDSINAQHQQNWLDQQVAETEMIRQQLQDRQHHPSSVQSSTQAIPQQPPEQQPQQQQRRQSTTPHFMLPTESAYIHAHSNPQPNYRGSVFYQHQQQEARPSPPPPPALLSQFHPDTQYQQSHAQQNDHHGSRRYSFAHHNNPMGSQFADDVSHHSYNQADSGTAHPHGSTFPPPSHGRRQSLSGTGSDTHSTAGDTYASGGTHTNSTSGVSSTLNTQTGHSFAPHSGSVHQQRRRSSSNLGNVPHFMTHTESYYMHAHSNPLVPSSPMHLDAFKQTNSRRRSSVGGQQSGEGKHFFPAIAEGDELESPRDDRSQQQQQQPHPQYQQYQQQQQQQQQPQYKQQYQPPQQYGQQQYDQAQQGNSSSGISIFNTNGQATYPQSQNLRSQYW